MPRRRAITNHELRQMRELAQAGVSMAETARAIGCSEYVIRYWARKVGLRFVRRSKTFWQPDPVARRRLEHILLALRQPVID